MPAAHPTSPTVQSLLDRHDAMIEGLGHLRDWPAALRVLLGIMLDTHQAMSVVWGDERRLLYNDAYVQFLGEKHPGAFGRRLDEVWPEIWSDIGPLVDRARGGEALYMENVPLTIVRGGGPTRAWFTFHYAPARDENRALCGMYSTVMETTGQVLGEKRQAMLLELSDRLGQARAPADVLHASTAVLAAYLDADDAGHLAVPAGDGDTPDLQPLPGQAPSAAWITAICERIRSLTPAHDLVTDGVSDDTSTPDSASPRALLLVRVGPSSAPASALCFSRTQGWTDTDLSVARDVARRASDAIDQWVTADQLQRLRERLEAQVAERTAELEVARREALRVAQRLQLTLASAQVGDWDLDLVTDEAYRSLRHDQCFGYNEPIAEWGFEKFIQHVHPDDRDHVAGAFRDAVAHLSTWDFECRVIWPDGSVHWIAAHGRVYDVDGTPTRMSGIVMDITARRSLAEELRQANRRKDEFLAMLAHELRNPLAPIGTAAYLLQRMPDDPERVRDASDIIGRQVRHMTELVDDLLDVSRVTRGLVQLERVPIDLRSVITAAVEQARPLTEARRHALELQLDAGGVPVLGDRARLIQVVANLLNNAAKYTPEGGRIRLDVVRGDEAVEIRVSDNGVGITASLLPVVFDLFTQAERTPDRSQGGLGIGLSLVKSIVQLHGGTVTAASQGPGLGSTFTISLPIDGAPAGSMDAPAVAGSAPKAQPAKILVVDDNEDAAATLAELLRLEGHEVEVAHTGHQALDTGRGVDFHAYILDVGLPDMTGYDLAARLRERCGAGAVFIAATGYGQQDDQARSRAAGFDHHLVKPVDTARLLELVRPTARSDA